MMSIALILISYITIINPKARTYDSYDNIEYLVTNDKKSS